VLVERGVIERLRSTTQTPELASGAALHSEPNSPSLTPAPAREEIDESMWLPPFVA
jgi:hypothetical protein